MSPHCVRVSPKLYSEKQEETIFVEQKNVSGRRFIGHLTHSIGPSYKTREMKCFPPFLGFPSLFPWPQIFYCSINPINLS